MSGANHRKVPEDPRSRPHHKYNPFSRTFFCWVEPLLYRGYRRTLQHEDLYTHPAEGDAEYLLEKFKRHWKVEIKKYEQGGTAYLSVALLKTCWWHVLVNLIFLAGQIPFPIGAALFLGMITDYLSLGSPSTSDTRNAYLSALGLSIMTFCLALSTAIGAFAGYKFGMLTRVICTTAIYEKILSLSQGTISSLTVGHIINLASNDVHRFDYALVHFPFGPVFILFAAVVLYYEISWVAFIAVAMVVGQIPVQIFLSKMLSNFRLKAAKVTDKRVSIMNEVISGIRVIKMYGWESAFHKLVSNIRHQEMMIILKSSIIRAINLASYATTLPTMTFVVFSIYAAIGGCITLRKVFVTLALLSSARILSNYVFVSAIFSISEAVVAIKRIQRFLLLKDMNQLCFQESQINQVNVSLNKSTFVDLAAEATKSDSFPFVSASGLCVSWSGDTVNDLLLKDVTFTIDQRQPLLAVIGSVGVGKSTLLQCLLGELSPVGGTISMEGTVAYAGQEPWVFSDTLRENILFGRPYNSDWYSEVMDMCALEKDIDSLPRGDLTLIGERGVTLSGGQKARVGLARAVYRRAGIYLLDDPLSAVDAAVSRHIFNRCIKGFLTETSVVILVTHQLQYVQQCDAMMVIKEGSAEIFNKPNDIKAGGAADSALKLLERNDTDDQLFSVRKFSVAEIESRDNSFKPSLKEVAEDDTMEKELSAEYTELNPSSTSNHNQLISSKGLSEEERTKGTVSYKTYHNYFKAGGGSLYTIGMLAIFLLAEVSVVISDGWLANWADDSDVCYNDTITTNTTSNVISTNLRIGIYGALVVVIWVLCLMRTILFYIILLKAATFLHNKMFICVLRTPILFFDTNPVGRILNRFSKDTGFLDDIVIYIFCEFLQFFTRFLAIVLTTAIAVYYLLPFIVLMVIGFTVFRWYFLKTSREIKRLEALARSPLYSHISMTLQGLSTIRAYQKQKDLLQKFFEYQNYHTQTWYLYIVTTRWFGLRIDAVCVLFIALIAFVSIPLSNVLNAEFVGLALTYSISLIGIFQDCVRHSAEIEALLVSAERLMEYGKLRSEEKDSLSNNPPSNWPDKGVIEITDLCYTHSTNGPQVLHNINCTIESGEKVGIVGRTGAGKSSLVACLFRLAQPNGSIKIDGVECFDIRLNDLRPKISIIPQDPVLFSGSVRYNLDPFNQYDDEKIWTALKQVQLGDIVKSLEGGLDAVVTEGGNNFSVGQKQLFCLARALLKHNRILILDEATANVDLETDSIIQRLIRELFHECTVLTIAHRLDTVMDSDKIMVLKSGELIEYGEPYDLLCNPDSYLLKLVEQTGPIAAEKLKNIVFSVHIERN